MKRRMVKSSSLLRCKAVLQILARHPMTSETWCGDNVGRLILFVLFLFEPN